MGRRRPTKRKMVSRPRPVKNLTYKQFGNKDSDGDGVINKRDCNNA